MDSPLLLAATSNRRRQDALKRTTLQGARVLLRKARRVKHPRSVAMALGFSLLYALLASSPTPLVCAGPKVARSRPSAMRASLEQGDRNAGDLRLESGSGEWPPLPPSLPPPHASNASSCDTDRCLCGGSYGTLWLVTMALLLMCHNVPPDLVLLACTTVLLLSGVIDDDDAWRGFSSPSILSIAVLFVIARGLEETRCVEMMFRAVLGRPASVAAATLSLTVPTAFFSAFMNNTPIVAMLLPVTEAWAARCSIPARVLMMPLSFASLMGGMCTLIGSSTNMVLNAQIAEDEEPPCEPFTMFEFTAVGAPAALVGLATLALLAPRLLAPPVTPRRSLGVPSRHRRPTAAGAPPPLPPTEAADADATPPAARRTATYDAPLAPRAPSVRDLDAELDRALDRRSRGDSLCSGVGGMSALGWPAALGGAPAVTAGAAGMGAAADDEEGRSALRRYDLQLTLLPSCELLDEPPSTLERIVGGADAAAAPSADAPVPAADGGGGQGERTEHAGGGGGGGGGGSASIAELRWVVRDGRDCGAWRRGEIGWGGLRLQAWDRLGVSCVAEAVPRLRRVRGLRALAEDASDALGERRRYRCLCECVLALGSPMVGLTAMEAATEPLLQQAAIWAVRQTSLARDERAQSSGGHAQRWAAAEGAPCAELTSVGGGAGGSSVMLLDACPHVLDACPHVLDACPHVLDACPHVNDASVSVGGASAFAAEGSSSGQLARGIDECAATNGSRSGMEADVPPARRTADYAGGCAGSYAGGYAGSYAGGYAGGAQAVDEASEWLEGSVPTALLQPLRPGDTILLEAPVEFAEQHRTDSRFALLSIVVNSMPPRSQSRRDQARLALSILLLLLLCTVPTAAPSVGLLPFTLCVAYALVGIQVGRHPPLASRARPASLLSPCAPPLHLPLPPRLLPPFPPPPFPLPSSSLTYSPPSAPLPIALPHPHTPLRTIAPTGRRWDACRSSPWSKHGMPSTTGCSSRLRHPSPSAPRCATRTSPPTSRARSLPRISSWAPSASSSPSSSAPPSSRASFRIRRPSCSSTPSYARWTSPGWGCARCSRV